MTTRSETDAALAEVYARIPRMQGCDGRCWTSCGPVDMSWRERQRIREAGVRITPWREAMGSLDTFWCDALTGDKRCAVYERRPLVCRLWGAAEGLECPFGCTPEGGYLTRAEARELLARSLAIGGHENAPAAAVLDRMSTEAADAMTESFAVRGKTADRMRARHALPPGLRGGAA